MGWLERRRKRKLLGHKRIDIHGMRFTIRRVNPLMDFPVEKVPQLFTEFQSARKPDPTKPPTIEQIKAMREQMMTYIEAGVVEPRLVPVGIGDKRGKEDGLTVEDLFRDQEIGSRLYFEIINHSLNTFRGIKSVFFSIKQRLLLFTLWHLGMALNRWMSSIQTPNQPLMNDNSLTSLSPELPPKKNTDNMNDLNATLNVGGVNG